MRLAPDGVPVGCSTGGAHRCERRGAASLSRLLAPCRPRLASPRLANLRLANLRLASLLAASLLLGCRGPTVQIEAAGPVFVDGRAHDRGAVPFRYYGMMAVDAMPEAFAAGPDWTLAPSRQFVRLEPPAPRWLFPLDFLVDLGHQALSGPGDLTVQAAHESAPAQVTLGFPPEGLESLRERALAKRTQR